MRAFCLLLATCAVSVAASVNLSWQANTDNVAGYKIHYGTSSRNYTQHLDVGKVTSATVSNLANGTLYFFAATAYNAVGIEGNYSNEVRSDAPTPTPTPSPTPAGTFTIAVSPSPGVIAQHGWTVTYTVKLTGSGFIGPVTLTAPGMPDGVSAVFASNPILSKTTMKVTIDDCLPRGSYSITVTGKSGALTRTANATLVKQ